MATTTAKAKRRALARQRLSDHMATLADRYGITLPDEPRPVRDPELAHIMDLERQGDLLAAIVDAAPEPKPEPKAEAPKPAAKPGKKG